MCSDRPAVDTLSPPSARSIILSLADGVVPSDGVHLFTAGRKKWLESLGEDLEDVALAGGPDGRLRIFNGRNGDGKTHLMHLLRGQAMAAGYAVSYVTISTEIPLYRWDLVYSAIGQSIMTAGRPDSPGLRTLLDPRSPDPAIVNDFQTKAAAVRSLHRVDPTFATVVYRYCTEQTVNLDRGQDMLLLGAWLEGKGQRLGSMAITTTVDQANGASMVRSLALVLRHFGIRGLVVLVDEVESVLSLKAPQRKASYQTLRMLVDRANIPAHALLVASTTPPMFTDKEKGIATYPALLSRLKPETHSDFINYHGTVVDLPRTPLSEEDFAEIGRCIRAIHGRARQWDPEPRLPDDFLVRAARVAASNRLTLAFAPTRVFVKLVTDMLELAHQHPDFVPNVATLDIQFADVDQALSRTGGEAESA